MADERDAMRKTDPEKRIGRERLWGDGQLGLFQPRPLPPEGRERLVELATRLPPDLRLGTSSWTFPGWAGLVYRERYRNERDFVQRSLGEYARHPLFRTVCMDRAFYAPIPREELSAYAKMLPPDFRCVSKVFNELSTWVFPKHPRYGPRAGRRNEGFLDPWRFEELIGAPMRETFADHLGPLIIEVPPVHGPPDPEVFADAVERFLTQAAPDLDYAFEIRDARLFTPRYLSVLRDHGASHVFNLWTRMPTLGAQLERVERVLGTGWVGEPLVVRLMIPPGKQYGDLAAAFVPFDQMKAPQPQMRDDVVRLVDAARAAGTESWVIVNNKAEGSSPLTVVALAERLAR